jgi:hypothetical protein
MSRPDDDGGDPLSPAPPVAEEPAWASPDDPGVARVRAGVMGAPAAPRLQVIEGGGGRAGDRPGGESAGSEKNAVQDMPGGGGGNGREDAADTVEGSCPLVCLGHADGEWHFLDSGGQRRKLKSKPLTTRGDLVSLFLGDTDWLHRWFPNRVEIRKRDAEGNEIVEEQIRGFKVAQAGEHLMQMCARAGLFGKHVVMRGPGVWAGDKGRPVVHAGDEVLVGGAWRRSGYRDGNQVWTSAARHPRPGTPDAPRPGQTGFAADAEVARELQRGIAELWQFRLGGSEIICLGLMAIGYYGTAARWRSNGYLIGGTGSGKSMLLQLLRACVPGSEFTTDTTKAGIEAAINGKPTPVYIDEAGDRQGHAAQTLLDVVLSATGGDGTRGLRGAVDGGSRSFEAACSVMMAAVSPPQMGPQHRDRITVIHLLKPGAGADNRAQMEALTRWAEEKGPQLWGRAIEGWERWEAARLAFREALARAQCAAREMDQMGAILAAWWVLTEDGAPDVRQADDGVAAVREFIRGASAVAEEDGPRRVVQFLASTEVQLHRSTDKEQIGRLVRQAWNNRDLDEEPARRVLERVGIRIVGKDEIKGTNGKRIPRGTLTDGMWFAKNAETLRRLFHGSEWEGDRWLYELGRHPTAVESTRTIRVGGVTGAAIWLAREDWEPPSEDDDPPDG